MKWEVKCSMYVIVEADSNEEAQIAAVEQFPGFDGDIDTEAVEVEDDG